ncbi:MAG: murein transglycosylase A [Cyanophyceae cyanobacterium]
MNRLALLALCGLAACSPPASAQMPLRSLEQSCVEDFGQDQLLWQRDRQAFVKAINYSLRYLNTPKAATAYQNYSVPGVTRDRIRRSLRRFRDLLLTSPSAAEFQAAVAQEFVCYEATGNEQGTVAFTGYFEPVYSASRVPTAEYRYPLYRKPSNFESWPMPHPTRVQLEGADGLGTDSPLAGQELVWLRDRLEAFLVQVQGSARLQLADGGVMTVGYAGSTDYPYTSLGRQLVDEGIFTLEEMTLPLLLDYFNAHPDKLNQYIPRNERFIFFRETQGAPPTGSLGVPVTANRSIATDKSLMPPGALALIHTAIPQLQESGLETSLVSRYVLDQDTGSAIKGAGRVDVFLGSGSVAGDRAGLLNSPGKLYYLLLK